MSENGLWKLASDFYRQAGLPAPRRPGSAASAETISDTHNHAIPGTAARFDPNATAPSPRTSTSLLEPSGGTDEGSLAAIPDRPRARWDFPDMAQSFGSGLIEGGSQLAGLPGDLKQMVASAHEQFVRPIEQRLGFEGPSPEKLQQIYAAQPSLAPSSERVAQLAAALMGPPYQPQTEAGDLALNIGRKIPGLPVALALGRR